MGERLSQEEMLSCLLAVLYELVKRDGGSVTLFQPVPIRDQFRVSVGDDGAITVTIADGAPSASQ